MANYASVENFGDPRSPGWEDQNLTSVAAPNGQSWRVNRQAAAAFQGLLGDLLAAGYNPTSSGGFNYRTIRGSDKLSQHAFGTAVDINAATNALGSTSTDMPANIGEIAAKHGLEWGGNWKSRPDPMHFEWTGGAGGAAPTVAAAYADPRKPQGTLADALPGATLPQGATPMPAITAPDPGMMAMMNIGQGFQQRQKDEADAEQKRKQALFGGRGGIAGMFA